MKPWQNPLFQTTCYICGRSGWNKRGLDAWNGMEFRCADGCDPRDVEEYLKEKQEAKKSALKDYCI